MKKLKYKIGQIIKTETKTFEVVGYENIKNTFRYILVCLSEDTVKLNYLYDWEISFLTKNVNKNFGYKKV